MQVRQCDFCRAPFQSVGNKICSDCLAQLDQDFIDIREYLYDHDGAGIEEVHEATGVPRKSIFHLLKEERLIVGDKNGDGCGLLMCESCRKPINTGRLCAGCKQEVMSAIQESYSPVPRPKKKPASDDMMQDNIKGVAKLQVKS